MGSWHVENGIIHIEMPTLDPQVLPDFPVFDIQAKRLDAVVDFTSPINTCGNQQRAYNIYWGIRAFVEHNGIIGIDLGSAGVLTPGCISSDIVGTGELCPYGDRNYDNVHLKIDAADLSILGTNTFSCVIANHIWEHLACNKIALDATPQQRLSLGCTGRETIDVLRNHWIRIVRPGGYVCIVVPDEKYARESNDSVLKMDRTHKHAPDSETFMEDILNPLLDIVEVVEYDTLQNKFSFNALLRKR